MSLDPVVAAKENAARHAVREHIHHGMSVGLGSGTTAAFAVRALAERLESEDLHLKAVVATSRETADLARSFNITLRDELDPADCPLDVTIDGADEADPALTLIKGGGGASLREKLVAAVTTKEIIVVHPSKRVASLGLTFPLPVLVVPYGWRTTRERVESVVDRPSVLRMHHNGSPFVTDDGLFVLDITPGPIDDPSGLEHRLKELAGVVDTGLFIGMAKLLIVGYPDGRIEEFEPVH